MPDRDTSVSKKVKGLHEDENALDRTKGLKDKFDAAAEQDNRKPGVRPKGPEQDGSRMIREDAPALQPTPPGQMRRVPDRFAAIRKLEQERKEAEAQNEAAKAWQKFQDQQRDATDRQQDNEREKTALYGNPPERSPENEKEKSPQETPEQAWERFQKREQEIERDIDPGRERE